VMLISALGKKSKPHEHRGHTQLSGPPGWGWGRISQRTVSATLDTDSGRQNGSGHMDNEHPILYCITFTIVL
jgi:hypothetical protein